MVWEPGPNQSRQLQPLPSFKTLSFQRQSILVQVFMTWRDLREGSAVSKVNRPACEPVNHLRPILVLLVCWFFASLLPGPPAPIIGFLAIFCLSTDPPCRDLQDHPSTDTVVFRCSVSTWPLCLTTLFFFSSSRRFQICMLYVQRHHRPRIWPLRSKSSIFYCVNCSNKPRLHYDNHDNRRRPVSARTIIVLDFGPFQSQPALLGGRVRT